MRDTGIHNISRNAKQRLYIQQNPHIRRKCKLMYYYKMTLEQYDSLVEQQNNTCAICKKPETSSRRLLLAVDHDHKTGKIRGLLCDKCNRGIGLLQDSPEILQAAIEYLRK